MKRKGIEALKSVIIVLLIISALAMIVHTALTGAGIQYSWRELPGLLFGREEVRSDSELNALHAARPVQAAVMSENGTYGVSRGFEELDGVYDSFSLIFSEAVGSAKEPEAKSEQEWLAALSSEGVYLAFDVRVPLSTLAGWLSGVCPVDFEADRFILSARNNQAVELWYGDGVEYFRCATSASSDMLLDRMEQYRPNGVRFAFELADTWSVYNNVDPSSIVPGTMSADVYSVKNSLDAQAVNLLMESLLINPFTESGYTDENGVSVYLCTGGTLRVGSDGIASYELNSIGRQEELFTAAQGGELDFDGAVEMTRQFAEKTVGNFSGSARVYLSGVEKTETGCIFTYSYYVDAMKALPAGSDFAARFVFDSVSLSSMELSYRYFSRTDANVELMQPLYAAATYPALMRARLCAAYTQSEDGLLTAWWHIG